MRTTTKCAQELVITTKCGESKRPRTANQRRRFVSGALFIVIMVNERRTENMQR